MVDDLYYKRLLIVRDKLLEHLLVLEAQVPQASNDTAPAEQSVRERALKKVRKAAEQLMSLNSTIQEMERQENKIQ